MEAIAYSRLRANLASVMDRVVQDHDAVIITRNSEPAVVMLSLDDYESMVETAYLMRSPKNAKRLMDSIDEVNADKNLKTTTLSEIESLSQ